MVAPEQSAFINQLLRGMAAPDFEALQPHLQPMELPRQKTIIRPFVPISEVYFPESGICSVVAQGGSERLEVGVMGREGMAGSAVIAGDDRSPFEHVGQIPGYGYGLSIGPLNDRLRESPELRRFLSRYLYFSTLPAASAVINHRCFRLEARMALERIGPCGWRQVC